MKRKIRDILFALFIVNNGVYADSLQIKLTKEDQSKLAHSFSRLDYKYQSEERIDTSPYLWKTIRHYQFLDETHGLSIKCSQEFLLNSSYPSNGVCNVTFNSDLSVDGFLEVHDGFMPVFIIAEIKNSEMARILYEAISKGMNLKEVFYHTYEEIPFKHPTTGQIYPFFRLRIDCKRDDQYKNFSCIASAVK